MHIAKQSGGLASSLPSRPPAARVLVIDDDADDRELITDFLSGRTADYSVDTRSSADDGWEALATGDYDVCLLDQHLGQTSGVDLLRRARLKRIGTPVIMLTGQPDDAVDLAAHQAGAVDFLEKERLDGRLLARALRYAIGRKAAEKDIVFQARLLDAVREAVIATDLSGTILYWNRFAARLYGWDSHEVIGRDIGDLRTMILSTADSEDSLAALYRGESWSAELIASRRDGSQFRASVVQSPIESPTMGLVGIISVTTDITERRRAADLLRANEERLRILFESAPDGVFLLSPDGVFVDGNLAAEQMCGVKRHDLIGKSLFSAGLLAEDDLDRARQSFEKHLRGAATLPSEYDLVRPDGSTLPVEIRTYRVEIEGTPVIMGVARDITERRRALADLSDSEQRFRALVEHTTVGVWQLDTEGRTTYVNPAMRAMLEAEGEVTGRSFADFFTAEGAETIRRQWQDRGQFGTSRYEVDLQGLRGTSRRVLISGAPIHAPDGTMTGRMGAIVDISDRIAAEAARAASEQKFALAFHANATPMVMMTDSFTVAEVNDAFLTLFEVQRETLVGRPSEALGFRSSLSDRHDVRKTLLREGRVSDVEAELMTASGRRKVGLISAQVIEIGSRRHLLAQFHDLTERRRLEDQLVQAQKMESVGRLAGGVAHDFNNILTAILGYSELMLGAPANAMDRGDVIEIRDAANRASTLTAQLLAFSRKQVLMPQVVDLNALVRDAERMLRRIIGEDIKVEARLVDGVHLIEADPGQLHQILLNLAVNARDAMPRGGTLVIETANVSILTARTGPSEIAPGDYVGLSVRDTGIGMSADVQSKVFEPFFTTKAAGKGTGLGLSTVHGIVHQSGGHIAVHSRPGMGTSFDIHFPTTTKVLRPRPTRTDAPAPVQEGTKILLVEDSDSVRPLVARMLTTSGYVVLEAASAADADRLVALHGDSIRLVITDVVMPGESGPDLVARLQQRMHGAPVLFMSGYTGEAMANYGVAASGIPFIQKPFTPRALADKVRELLAGR